MPPKAWTMRILAWTSPRGCPFWSYASLGRWSWWHWLSMQRSCWMSKTIPSFATQPSMAWVWESLSWWPGEKKEWFFILSHALWQFFLIFHCGSRKGSPFPLPSCILNVCLLCLFVSQSFQLRPSSSWATEWTSDCLKVSNALRDWAIFD